VPANARRKCIEIESILPELAKEAAKRIGELHAIKKQRADADDDKRRQIRLKHAVRGLNAIRSWIELLSAQVQP
jgi:hypothetical protein